MMEDKKKSIITIVMITSAIVGVAVYFWIFPDVNKIERKTLDVQKQRAQLEQFQKKDSLSLQENYKKIESDIPAIESALVEKENIIRLIEILERIASDTSVAQDIAMEEKNPTKTTPDVETEESKKLEEQENNVYFRIVASGTFSNVLNYLNKVENMEIIIDIETIKIQTQEQKMDTKNPEEEAETTKESISATLNIKVPIEK
ncbi:MAG: hypothetical protein ACD_63C00157G0003 [uncultured bacterium]|nr:MAG: hypothetical protein ACD_63C00157G0003 [uncultured bacterium]